MKRRKLRPAIRTALEIITMFLVVMVASINDFSLSAIPVILLAIVTIAFNLEVLENF